VRIVPEIPLTGVGKLDRKRMRAEVRARHAR
jgi:acyl-CoA synthetase (AMP-forming)/AMP-acid ligase II